jgi:hypothetical protein
MVIADCYEGRTVGFSEPERLTQRKPKRLIEGFVCEYAQHGRDLIG